MFHFCKDIYVSNQQNKVNFMHKLNINRFITIYTTFEYLYKIQKIWKHIQKYSLQDV